MTDQPKLRAGDEVILRPLGPLVEDAFGDICLPNANGTAGHTLQCLTEERTPLGASVTVEVVKRTPMAEPIGTSAVVRSGGKHYHHEYTLTDGRRIWLCIEDGLLVEWPVILDAAKSDPTGEPVIIWEGLPS